MRHGITIPALHSITRPALAVIAYDGSVCRLPNYHVFLGIRYSELARNSEARLRQGPDFLAVLLSTHSVAGYRDNTQYSVRRSAMRARFWWSAAVSKIHQHIRVCRV